MNTLFLQPAYTHPCSEVNEDHARHIVLHQYVACLRIANEWAVPRDDELIWLDLPAVVDILVGCCLWNTVYGVFRVTAHDKLAQKVQLQRVDIDKTAEPGTVIGSCTKFIVIPDTYE